MTKRHDDASNSSTTTHCTANFSLRSILILQSIIHGVPTRWIIIAPSGVSASLTVHRCVFSRHARLRSEWSREAHVVVEV